MRQAIEPGFMVFLAEGRDPAGAVRGLRDDGRLLVNIENGGDFVVAADAVSAVHDDKVVLDYRQLPTDMREALRHLHDAEDDEYRAADPAQGTPDEQ